MEPIASALPPPPRVVRGGVGRLWVVRLFITPHLCAGLFLLGQFGADALVAAFGTDVSAVVTRAHATQSRKRGTTYSVVYHYQVGDREYDGSGNVGAGTYSRVRHVNDAGHGPETVRVRQLALGSLHWQRLTEDSSVWGLAAGELFFALFWNSMMAVLLYLVWIKPWRDRRLIRDGRVAEGRILSSRMHRGRSRAYYATFAFQDADSGREITKQVQLPGAPQFDRAQQGGPVTVLYDPSRPTRAIAYELSGYQVVDELRPFR